MRLPRLRLTIRRIMIAVAVSCALLGASVTGNRIWVRHARFRQLAWEYSFDERTIAAGMQADERIASDLKARAAATNDPTAAARYLRGADEFRRASPSNKRLFDYYSNMRRKYEYAARFPWLPLEPDPPRPK